MGNTLNFYWRLQVDNRINVENAQIYERLMNVEPVITSVNRMEDDYRVHLERKKRLCKIRLNLARSPRMPLPPMQQGSLSADAKRRRAKHRRWKKKDLQHSTAYSSDPPASPDL